MRKWWNHLTDEERVAMVGFVFVVVPLLCALFLAI